jgi:Anti-sigma-K factor rskA, C-terminal
MTEDDDRVAYLAGEDGVELDELSRADLDDLRSLLADEALWAVPPDGLESAVVEAIVAEAASRPVDAAAPVRPPAPPSRPGEVVAMASRRRRGGGLLAAAAAVVLLAAGGLVLATRRGDDAGTQVSLEATDVLPGASGEAHVRRTDSGWRILLDATGLPRLDDGQFYEAWLKSDDGVLVPIGTFNEGADVVLWAGVSPMQFPTLTVTQELADGDQASSGQVVLRGTIVLD